MLLPKRVKYRRVHRGRMTGKATRGNFVSNGEFGIQATEPCWITSNQIAAYTYAQRLGVREGFIVTPSVAVRYGSRFSPTSRLPSIRLVLEWVPVRAHPSTGLQ